LTYRFCFGYGVPRRVEGDAENLKTSVPPVRRFHRLTWRFFYAGRNMHQQHLFDDERPAKLARDSDPDTSHAAAADILPKLSVLEQRMLWTFRSDGPCTANEAAVIAEDDYLHEKVKANAETYRKRYDALLKKSRIKADGKKRCNISGKLATVYRITEGTK